MVSPSAPKTIMSKNITRKAIIIANIVTIIAMQNPIS